MHYKRRQRADDEPRLLPLDYTVGENVVMIGRGRKCLNNEGNRRFRVMVKAELFGYSAGRKAKKSSIIKRILREINTNCLEGIGFVKQDALTGRFYTATETAAKVTIAQAFRDALHEHGYKSSKQHKQFKRDVARGKVNPDGSGSEHEHEDDLCSTCEEEVRQEEEEEAKNAELAEANKERLEPLNVEFGMPPLKIETKPSGEETSLGFWETKIDPYLAEAQEHNNKLLEVPKAGPSKDVLSAVLASCQHDFPCTMMPKEVDPFEPIPLAEAMEVEHEHEHVRPTWRRERAPSVLDTDNSESGSSSRDPEYVDDDEENAIVAWSTEFVTCPRCAIVQGRYDFGDLPIDDIRDALIG